MPRIRLIAASGLLAVAACHTSSARSRDGGPDAPGDGSGATVDAYAGPCGTRFFEFSGTFLDWDSTSASPCPIAGSKWTIYFDTRSVTTDATGSLAICLAPNDPRLDVAPPVASSSCATTPGAYTVPGIAIATRAVVDGGGVFVARAMTSARLASFFTQVGSSFDPGKGDLLVHVDGPPAAVTISSSHDTEQTFDGTGWGSGDTGEDVFFPNIDLSGGNTTDVFVSGGAQGTGAVPLAPATITYMAVLTN